MKKLTLIYLATYLGLGGVGLSFIPETALKLFFSTGNYSIVIVQMVGMFMLVLSVFVSAIVFYEDYKYYKFTIIVRTGIVGYFVYFYLSTKDPLFLIGNVIVLMGLLPAYFVYFGEMLGKSKIA